MQAHLLIELVQICLSLAFLAFVLGFVGHFLNKFIKHSQQSRFASKVNSAAYLARQRALARQGN